MVSNPLAYQRWIGRKVRITTEDHVVTGTYRGYAFIAGRPFHLVIREDGSDHVPHDLIVEFISL